MPVATRRRGRRCGRVRTVAVEDEAVHLVQDGLLVLHRCALGCSRQRRGAPVCRQRRQAAAAAAAATLPPRARRLAGNALRWRHQCGDLLQGPASSGAHASRRRPPRWLLLLPRPFAAPCCSHAFGRLPEPLRGLLPGVGRCCGTAGPPPRSSLRLRRRRPFQGSCGGVWAAELLPGGLQPSLGGRRPPACTQMHAERPRRAPSRNPSPSRP